MTPTEVIPYWLLARSRFIKQFKLVPIRVYELDNSFELHDPLALNIHIDSHVIVNICEESKTFLEHITEEWIYYYYCDTCTHAVPNLIYSAPFRPKRG